MNPQTLTQLRDIHGLDTIPWWPLAPGWWLVLVAIALTIAIGVLIFQNLRRYPFGSWQRDAWRQLRQLKSSVGKQTDKELATSLSELLRRIAIARLGREQSAGLSGQNWLTHLQENDPRSFLWETQGKILMTLPYAPVSDSQTDTHSIKSVLQACFPWVDYRNRRRGV